MDTTWVGNSQSRWPHSWWEGGFKMFFHPKNKKERLFCNVGFHRKRSIFEGRGEVQCSLDI